MAGSLRTQLVTLALLTGGGLALACGDDGGNDGGTPPNTTAIAKASSNSGDAQTATVGQPLTAPLQVVVTEGGAPSAGKTVTWATASGGSLDPASTATNSSGVATTSWTLGTTSGAQTATATLSGASGSPVTFNATADPDAPAALSQAGGDQQNASLNSPLPLPVQAKVADQFGNGVPDVPVAWSATGGSVSAASVPSDAVGISSVTVTAGATAGPITIVATAEGLTGSPLTFTATAAAAPAIPTTASVKVGNIFFTSNVNATSNPAVDTVAVGGTVTWSWVGGTHSVQSTGTPSFTSSAVQSSGSYEFTFATAGTYQYTCAVHPAQMTGRVVVR
jgi:plastocyanin